MTPSPTAFSAPAPRSALRCAALALLFLPAAGIARAQPAPDSTSSDTLGAATVAAAQIDPTSTGSRLVDAGLENVRAGLPWTQAENRRYRSAATAIGIVARTAGSAGTIVDRLGLPSAAIPSEPWPPARVLYPSDGSFPPSPSGPPLAPTWRSFDLLVRPLFTYELGRVFDPVLVRVEVEPELRWNSWPGGRMRAGLVIPLRNDFELDALHPDLNRVRPGAITLEQYAWAPGTALLSGTVGMFGSNRYGMSLGIARPLAAGNLLFDAQGDLTGFVAMTDTGTVYSTPSLWTGFAGVTWHPPLHVDVAVRLRAEKFLFGDHGVELQVQRSMGDLDVAFFAQRTGGFDVSGVRLEIPLPPVNRPVHPRVRVLPVDRFPIEYHSEEQPVGREIPDVASREELLRQLSPRSLAANTDRFLAGRDGAADRPAREGLPERVSLTGMSGFINTPWCGVLADRDFEVGYNTIPKEVAWDHRGEHRNDVYYAALGFLPHLEVGLRWTVIPGLKSFSDLVPDSKLTDSDRMLSGRLELLAPRPGRPGLAVGIEDAIGTRRFHSTYAVAGMPFAFQWLKTRTTVGYAPHVLTASRHTLDGAFGALEVTPWRPVAAALEYDTEKTNTSLGIDLGFGVRVRIAMLDLRHPSFGAGWAHSL